jgi:hypothetical protein
MTSPRTPDFGPKGVSIHRRHCERPPDQVRGEAIQSHGYRSAINGLLRRHIPSNDGRLRRSMTPQKKPTHTALVRHASVADGALFGLRPRPPCGGGLGWGVARRRSDWRRFAWNPRRSAGRPRSDLRFEFGATPHPSPPPPEGVRKNARLPTDYGGQEGARWFHRARSANGRSPTQNDGSGRSNI